MACQAMIWKGVLEEAWQCSDGQMQEGYGSSVIRLIRHVQNQAFALEEGSQACIQELKQAKVFTGRIQHFGPYICRAAFRVMYIRTYWK
jgi:hypothetical protein